MLQKKTLKRSLPGLTIILLLVMSFTLAVRYVDKQLDSRTYPGVYDDCHKVWATRGLVLEGPAIMPDGTQNSIESIQLAFDRGARGTEVDVHFDTDTGKFMVAHDIPYNLKNGGLLTLEELFRSTAGERYFWIDFKKIRKLSDEELDASVAELDRITRKFGIKKWIYVEGETPFSLAAYRDAGFNTILDAHPRSDNNLFTPVIIGFYKLVFYFGDFTVMAMSYGPMDDPRYGPRTQRSLGSIPLFVYHIEDEAEALDRLQKVHGVRVILIADHSVDRYQLDSCPETQGSGSTGYTMPL